MRTLKPKTNKQLAVIRSSCFYILMPAHRAHALLSPSLSLSLPPIPLLLPFSPRSSLLFVSSERQLTSSSTNFLSDLRGTELLYSALRVFAFLHPSANVGTSRPTLKPRQTHDLVRISSNRETTRSPRRYL